MDNWKDSVKTPGDAVRELRDFDHLFMTVTVVKFFNKWLGVTIEPYTAHADPTDPKGLTFSDGAKSAPGYDAAAYAVKACRQLGLTCPFKYGRGSQLAAACDTLAVHFSAVRFADEKMAEQAAHSPEPGQ